jgi:hypothetical protein
LSAALDNCHIVLHTHGMTIDIRTLLLPGARIRVTQQIAARHYTLGAVVEGVIISYQQKPTGSWFAHGRDDKLWLDRVVIQKADGEISTLNLDDYASVEMLDSAPLTPAGGH